MSNKVEHGDNDLFCSGSGLKSKTVLEFFEIDQTEDEHNAISITLA